MASGFSTAALTILQDRGAEFFINPQGAIRLKMPIPRARDGRFGISAIIEEDVQDLLRRGFGFAEWVLGEIDPTQRLTHSAPAVTIDSASVHAWRTRRQHDSSPDRMTMRMPSGDPEPILLSPPVRPAARCISTLSALSKILSPYSRALTGRSKGS